MKNKWYLLVLLFAMAIIGIRLEKGTAPNQEIVVQFTDGQVTYDETECAIALIKNQLKAVDVADIHIQNSGNGTLKITYYSDVEVSKIKKILSQESDLALDPTWPDNDGDTSEFPSEKEVMLYQLDVYEIHDMNDLLGSDGNVVELKSEIIRFFTPDVYASIDKVIGEEKSKSEKVAYTIHRNIAIAIDNYSYNNPEVRAGPTL